MRYRLLKEIQNNTAVGIITASFADHYYVDCCFFWAKIIGDRDVCRENVPNFEKDWAVDIGDIEFMKNSLAASDPKWNSYNTKDLRVRDWNNTYRGTKYEISTSKRAAR